MPILTAGGVPLTDQEAKALYNDFKRRMADDWIKARQLSILGDADCRRILPRITNDFPGASDYIGVCADGGPAGGYHNTGCFGISAGGRLWYCSTGGNPGTWRALNGGNWYARMTRAAAFTTTASSDGAIMPWDTVTYDPAGLCTTGASAKVTIPTGGTGQWLISGQIHLAAAPAGDYFLDVNINGVTAVRHDIERFTFVAGESGLTTLSWPGIQQQLAAGDRMNWGYYTQNAQAIGLGGGENWGEISFMGSMWNAAVQHQ